MQKDPEVERRGERKEKEKRNFLRAFNRNTSLVLGFCPSLASLHENRVDRQEMEHHETIVLCCLL